MENEKFLKDKLLIILVAISTAIYFIWRIFFTLPIGHGFISLFFGLLLLLAEVLGIMNLVVNFNSFKKSKVLKPAKIRDNLFCNVDVFIATYNEPKELLRKTVLGCLNMDYPDKKKVHIYLCDDGKRDEIKELADEYRINYITRDDRKGAKAGNLNNALKNSSSPLVVTFDADMIPMHNFLTSTIPYFIKKSNKSNNSNIEFENIGFIQTPQSFYNPDLFQLYLFSEDSIPNEQDYFYKDVQIAKNSTNSPIYGGSNTVLLRKAIEDVGGFYTNSITEDFATGILIQNKGYKCYAISQVLASGLSPTDLKSLIKQRERWARGCIQTLKRLKVFSLTGLNRAQKISCIITVSYWYSCLKRLIYIISPILYSVFGVIVVRSTLYEALIFWLPSHLFINLFIKRMSKNRRNMSLSNIYESIMFQPLIPAVLLETFGISKKTFSVTQKTAKEDDVEYKIKLIFPYLIYIVFSFVGIFNTLNMMIKYKSLSPVLVLFWLLFNLYGLVMAVFFMMGRTRNRMSERFNAKINFLITTFNYKIPAITSDISETGFSFLLDFPEYISDKEDFEVEFHTNRHKVFAKAKIVFVKKQDDKWRYSAHITEISYEDKDKWLCIVYDRVPTLPTFVNENFNFYQTFNKNIKNRMHKQKTLSRSTPRISINQKIYIDKECGDAIVKDFNYNSVVLEFKDKNIALAKENDIVNIKIDNINFSCVLEDLSRFNNTNMRLFKITNIKDIINSINGRRKLKGWLKRHLIMEKRS